MSTFSQIFLDEFPSTRCHHNIAQSIVGFRGIPMTSAQKTLINAELQREGITQRMMAEYLLVSVRRIEKLVSTAKHNGFFSDDICRPYKVDDEGLEYLRQKILRRKDELNPIHESEWYPMVDKAASETDVRRGGNGLNVSVSKRTAKKMLKDMNASIEKGQKTTKARHRESKDIRNFIGMAIMNEACAKDKPPQMIGNYDATQFVVSVKNEELLITIKREHLNGSVDDGNLPMTSVDDSALSFGIKWMMTANAIGHLGDDVFLVNDPNMNPEDFHAYQIKGLTHRNDPEKSGWICFCKTRAGNANFFHWYTSAIMPNFVQQCRQLLSEDDQSQSFYMTADGEALQMQPFDGDDVMVLLQNINVDLGKGPASCTNTIGNACDRSHLFKAAKKTLKSINSETEVDFIDPVLENKLFKAMEVDHGQLSTEKRRNISKGIVKIARSLNKVVNLHIVSHGFQRIGLYPLDTRKCLGNMDLAALRAFSKQQIDSFVEKVSELTVAFLDEENGGQITEGQFDEAGIPQCETDDRRTLPKDARCLSNQRAVLISNPASRKRRQDWLKKRGKSAQNTLVTPATDDPPVQTVAGTKRIRAPNRPKEVIEEEKRQKQARREERATARTG